MQIVIILNLMKVTYSHFGELWCTGRVGRQQEACLQLSAYTSIVLLLIKI